MKIKKIVKERPLFSFFFLAYLFAWISWLPLVLSQTGIGLIPIKIPMPYVVLGTFAPLFAALLIQWLTHHNLKLFHSRFLWKYVLLALLAGFILIVVAFIIIPGTILTKPPLSSWNWNAFLSYPFQIFHVIFLAGGPLGEEPGWRGFALPRLLKKYNPFLASLILGVLWAGWHLPLFLIPTWSTSPIYVFALIIIGFTFILTLVYNLSKGNIAVTIIMHGVFNATPFILNDFLSHSATKNFISYELLLALSFSFIAIMLLLITRGKLGFNRNCITTGMQY